MMGNDLDNKPQSRYYVMAEVIYTRKNETHTETKGRWRKRTIDTLVTVWVPNLEALWELWKFSDRTGARLELVFTDDLTTSALELWELLDHAPNPFNDWHVFETRDKVVAELPYRPDLLGVIDLPTRSSIYGGRGLVVWGLR